MADEDKKSEGSTIIIKKIKKAAHGHHGGAWKVAYADFVTAMMAFFLLMWIVGQSQQTKEGIQRYFNDPIKYLFGAEQIFTGLFSGNNGKQFTSEAGKGGVTDGNRSGGISKLHLIADDIQKWTKPFKSDIYQFKVLPDRIQFAITAQALFSPGSQLLKADSQQVLNSIAKSLKPLGAHIMIEAHTDDLPIESPEFKTNWELSSARAATVVRYFIEAQGFDPAKLTAMSAAEFRPIADNSTPEGRSKNRRIDIYVIPDGTSKFNIRSAASEGIR
jgi:chemotaxis protein MotB